MDETPEMLRMFGDMYRRSHKGAATPPEKPADVQQAERVKDAAAARIEENKEKSKEESDESVLTPDDVWLLIRRFNKEIYHVKSTRRALPHELDLKRSAEESFSPEKLRTTLEWFYTSVVIGLANIGYEFTRLRSWKDPRRTSGFCIVYCVAWLWDLLIFVPLCTLILMVISPSFQSQVFPPERIAQDDGEGHTDYFDLPKRDSLTGTPESHKGETAEVEATNLVRDIAEITLESAATEFDDTPEGAEKLEGSKAKALKKMPSTDDEATKEQMFQRVSRMMLEVIRIISDVTETYEKCCNLFTPTPPFDLFTPRLRLIAFLSGAAVFSLLPTYWLVKIFTFLFGFVFFGDPVIQRGLRFLNERYPDWNEKFDIRETLLKDVPTNAQLTLTLLRLGEMSSSPLPPPPGPGDTQSGSVASQVQQRPIAIPRAEALALEASGLPFSGLIKFVRGAIGMGIRLRLIIDQAISVAGMSHPPHLIRLLRWKGWVSSPVGPLKFKAQFDRHRGTAVIDSTQEPPVFYFTTHNAGLLRDLRLSSQHKGSVLFQIPIPDIVEMKKTEKLGWKQKLILEMTGGVKYSVDGLVVRGLRQDQDYHLTHIKARDQLFNRLVAMGAQFWESW